MGFVTVSAKLDKSRDAALLEWLDEQGNKSNVIRRALYREMGQQATLDDVAAMASAILDRVGAVERTIARGVVAVNQVGAAQPDDDSEFDDVLNSI